MIKQRLPSAVTASNKHKEFEKFQAIIPHNQRNIKFETEIPASENIHSF